MNEEKKIEQKLAGSLTAETTELLPYLPYLLQDIWELGSNPRDIISLISEHIEISRDTKVIDLGCGKGAVTIPVCKELGVQAVGIDLLADFIDTARTKAEEYGVSQICEFRVQDINESVKAERDYDIVILGAVGDVLGDPAQTLAKLKGVASEHGYILIDEGYLEGCQDDVRYQNYKYLTLEQWQTLFAELNLDLIAQRTYEDTAESSRTNDYNNRMIKKRAAELSAKYPEKRSIFEGYVKSQEDECEDLDNVVVGVVWLLKRK